MGHRNRPAAAYLCHQLPRRLTLSATHLSARLPLLQANRKDKDGKFHLILVESRIHRLARYYKKSKKLPPNWK